MQNLIVLQLIHAYEHFDFVFFFFSATCLSSSSRHLIWIWNSDCKTLEDLLDIQVYFHLLTACHIIVYCMHLLVVYFEIPEIPKMQNGC